MLMSVPRMNRVLAAGCCLWAALAAYLFADAADTEASRQRPAAYWASRLGADRFQDRQEAARRLLEIGLPARAALRELRAADDPEVSQSAIKLWDQLLWQAVPGGRADLEALRKKHRNGQLHDRDLKMMIDKHGAPSVHLLLELRQQPETAKVAARGWGIYLESVPARAVLEALDSVGEEQRRDLATITDKLAEPLANARTGKVLLGLYYRAGEYKKTLRTAIGLWRGWAPQPEAVSYALAAIMTGDIEATMWEEAGEMLYNQRNVKFMLTDLLFYLQLARELNAGPQVSSLLAIAPLHDMAAKVGLGPDLAEEVADILLDLKLNRQADDLLAKETGPVPVYLRLVAGAGGDRAGIDEEQWTRIIESANSEEKCMDLARRLLADDLGDRARQLFERVLDLEPADSPLDGEAYLRLAYVAEGKAEFRRAAGYLEKALGQTKEHFSEGSAKELRARADRLKAKPAADQDAFAVNIQQGRRAYAQKDYAAAAKAFREAIRIRPKEHRGYIYLHRCYKADNRFDELRELGHKLPSTLPHSIALQRQFADVLGDTMGLARALETLNPMLADNKDIGALVNRAYVHERAGDFSKALADMEAALAMGLDNSHVHRSLGTFHLETGRPKVALRHFEEAFLLDPKQDYYRLFLSVARQRLKIDDRQRLARYFKARRLAPSVWVGRIIRYYLGELTADELLEAASIGVPERLARAQACEAYFYIAQQQLARGQIDLAKENFRRCVKYNINVFIEHPWAQAEIERIERGRE